MPLVLGSIQAAAQVRCVRLRKSNYVKIIPTNMMIREIIPGRQQRVRRRNVTVAGTLISSVKVSVALTWLKLINVVMTADWRWITDVSQSGGPDSRPRLEGARYKYLTSCSRLLSIHHLWHWMAYNVLETTLTHSLTHAYSAHPTLQSRIHLHTSLTKTPPLPGLAQWACYKGLSVWVQSRLDPCPKDDHCAVGS